MLQQPSRSMGVGGSCRDLRVQLCEFPELVRKRKRRVRETSTESLESLREGQHSSLRKGEYGTGQQPCSRKVVLSRRTWALGTGLIVCFGTRSVV